MAKKILIIEDESDQVTLLKTRLEANGCEVSYALNGEEGIKKAKEVKPELILLDLNMPKMNGFEVLKVLSKDENLKKIPVYVVTARADKDLLEQCKQAGAIGCILKPYDSKDLMDKINKV